MNLIGLDIGTTSICGVLYSIKKHKSLEVITKSNNFIKSYDNEYIQDPSDILNKIEYIVNELIEFSQDKIVALSLSSQMHGILYVDENGKSVSPFYTWQNKRGLKEINGTTIESYLTDLLGYPIYSGYGITTHFSLYIENKIPHSAKYFCTIGDYVCMRLANKNIPITDVTLASSMGIYDIDNNKKLETLNKLDRECSKYIPEISSSIKKLGKYKSIEIVQALGDNQASFLGAVKEKEKSVLLNYGTAGQISFYSSQCKSYNGFETRSLGVDEGYIYAAFSLCGGNSYKILSNFFNQCVSVFTNENDINTMKVMDNMELDFSKKEIECMPFFLGQRSQKSENAYFKNISEANFTVENIVKSLVQGMVDELYFNYLNLPKEVKDNFKYLIGAGNGIRKNNHLITALKQTYKKELFLLDLQEESCLGAIIHAAKAVGIYKNYGEGSFDIVKYTKA